MREAPRHDEGITSKDKVQTGSSRKCNGSPETLRIGGKFWPEKPSCVCMGDD